MLGPSGIAAICLCGMGKIGKIGAGALFDSAARLGGHSQAFELSSHAKLPEARTGPSHRALQLALCSL